MIKVFNIFTVKDRKVAEARPHLEDYLTMCVDLGMKEVALGQGLDNHNQFTICGYFDTKEDWQKLDEKLRQCEIDGDCFIELMPLLEKPPKTYSFETIEL